MRPRPRSIGTSARTTQASGGGSGQPRGSGFEQDSDSRGSHTVGLVARVAGSPSSTVTSRSPHVRRHSHVSSAQPPQSQPRRRPRAAEAERLIRPSSAEPPGRRGSSSRRASRRAPASSPRAAAAAAERRPEAADRPAASADRALRETVAAVTPAAPSPPPNSPNCGRPAPAGPAPRPPRSTRSPQYAPTAARSRIRAAHRCRHHGHVARAAPSDAAAPRGLRRNRRHTSTCRRTPFRRAATRSAPGMGPIAKGIAEERWQRRRSARRDSTSVHAHKPPRGARRWPSGSADGSDGALLRCMERSSRGARSGDRASRLGPFVSRLRR